MLATEDDMMDTTGDEELEELAEDWDKHTELINNSESNRQYLILFIADSKNGIKAILT